MGGLWKGEKRKINNFQMWNSLSESMIRDRKKKSRQWMEREGNEEGTVNWWWNAIIMRLSHFVMIKLRSISDSVRRTAHIAHWESSSSFMFDNTNQLAFDDTHHHHKNETPAAADNRLCMRSRFWRTIFYSSKALCSFFLAYSSPCHLIMCFLISNFFEK